MKYSRLTAAVAACALALVGCSNGEPAPSATPTETAAPAEMKKLTVIAHESFNLDPKLLDKFKAETGYDVKVSNPGDAGTVVNQLVLTKDSPTADVVFGIDNTFAGRAIKEGVVTPYKSQAATNVPDGLKADDSDSLTPIDMGDVCLNADTAWYKQKGLTVPETLDDLTKPEYEDQLVVENPASSSPGLAFLIATYGQYQDGWLDYWGKLTDNGVKVVQGWTEAYTVEYSGSSGKGTKPLVVSYSTSPAAEVPDDGGEPTSKALLGTCFRQVEYAGVIKGAKNEVGAQKFIDFLLSDDVQKSFPETMYMYPARTDVELPAEWQKYAPLADKPIEVDAATIADNRDQWVKDWTAKVVG